MSCISEPALRALRLRYNSAYTAYQSCVRALSEAATSGVRPSDELLSQEAAALKQLTYTRAKLLAAMAQG